MQKLKAILHRVKYTSFTAMEPGKKTPACPSAFTWSKWAQQQNTWLFIYVSVVVVAVPSEV